MLNVPPSQILVGIQHQRDDPSRQRGGARCAAEGVSDVAAAVVAPCSGDVRGGDALTGAIGVRGDQYVGPRLGVVGLLAVVVNRGDSDGEAAVGVTVVV